MNLLPLAWFVLQTLDSIQWIHFLAGGVHGKASNCVVRLKNAISELAGSSVIAEWRIRKKSNENDKKVN